MPEPARLVLPEQHTLVSEPHATRVLPEDEKAASAPQDDEIAGY